MIVILTRDYRCCPEGHTAVTYPEGAEVTGKVAKWALEDGAGKPKPEPRKRTPKPKVTKPAAPKHKG